jgi:pimeloyl-ACP methyl ester carboxylesterase
VTRAYFDALEAPAGKTLVVFENSAHTPFMAEAQKFNQELLRLKAETSQP